MSSSIHIQEARLLSVDASSTTSCQPVVSSTSMVSCCGLLATNFSGRRIESPFTDSLARQYVYSSEAAAPTASSTATATTVPISSIVIAAGTKAQCILDLPGSKL